MFWPFALLAASSPTDYIKDVIPSESHFQYMADTTVDTVLWPWKTFKSSHHKPPHMNITHRRGELADGYVFVTPSNIAHNNGTMELTGTGFIMDMDGQMIFAGEESGMGFCEKWIAGMTDFRRQDYQGRPYITYWNGCNTQNAHWGHRWGRVTFIDEQYENFTINPSLGINTLDPVTRGQIDVHEHQMTEDNTMLVSSYNNTPYDLSKIGGPKDSWVADSTFFEIDLESLNPVFEWSALDHIPISHSRMPWKAGGGATMKAPYDWFHINSVQKVGKDYLVSARHHWKIYLISGKNGRVIWTFDGVSGGDFGSIPAQFHWQHHARATNVTDEGMVVSLFNNKVNGAKNENTQTQALAFYLPLPAGKAGKPTIAKRLQTDSEPLFAGTQGSYQIDLGNGNGFVGYGALPIAREYGPAKDGSDLRWQGQFGVDGAVQSYRVFKAPWSGTPKNWDPHVVVDEQKDHGPRAYVSWNGATEIGGWAVYAGDSEDSLKAIGVAKKKGFETAFYLGNATCVQVGAIRNEKIIRSSNVACLGDG